jgi:hypothetical protein
MFSNDERVDLADARSDEAENVAGAIVARVVEAFQEKWKNFEG